jgi:phosphoribosylglycinamide formyltransferase-1
MANKRHFALLTEDRLHMSALVSLWRGKFEKRRDMSVVVQEVSGCRDYAARQRFHQQHHGQRELTPSELLEIRTLYGVVSQAEMELIAKSGVPPHAPDSFPEAFRIKNLNSIQMRDWVLTVLENCNEFWCFIFLDTILAPWWIALPGVRIVNVHSAVLPYARGMYALEQMALLAGREEFELAAGATAHYIDDKIDTGPVIKAVRIKDPFRYSSLGALKAACYELAFNLLCALAEEVIENPFSLEPAGMTLASIGPLFTRSQFTTQKSQLAHERWLSMKAFRTTS